MDDENAGPEQPAENLISRPPVEADLVKLCRALNQRGAKYVVICFIPDHGRADH